MEKMKKMKFLFNHLSSLQTTLDGEKLEEIRRRERERERERERAVLGVNGGNELKEFIIIPYKPYFASNPLLSPLITFWVEWRVIWSTSCWMESLQLRKLAYSSRYTCGYQEFPYSTKYAEIRIYEKVLVFLYLSLKHFNSFITFSLSSNCSFETISIQLQVNLALKPH